MVTGSHTTAAIHTYAREDDVSHVGLSCLLKDALFWKILDDWQAIVLMMLSLDA